MNAPPTQVIGLTRQCREYWYKPEPSRMSAPAKGTKKLGSVRASGQKLDDGKNQHEQRPGDALDARFGVALAARMRSLRDALLSCASACHNASFSMIGLVKRCDFNTPVRIMA